ncbi:MAG: hypothetical protein LBT08_00320 [Synergistaceae bacterium]|jgi:glutaconate CoA-transferase subunit A|nr:hypothetical protein [Synergistaceae bacterium]
MNKVMSAQEAVSSFVNDGDCLAVGGFVTNRRPYGLVNEVIRQNKKGLYVESGSAGGDIDMLIGTGCVTAILLSYIANSGYSMVCRRFRSAIERGGEAPGSLLFEDFSLDVQTIAYHGAALGLSYVPVKNMLGSDMIDKWGISEEERKKHPKLPSKKFIIQDDPFNPGSKLCLVPTPKIDVALIHAQKASPDGTCAIAGPQFQDMDIGIAAKHTIISCDELLPDAEMRRHPESNTLTGMCVDAVVRMPYGAHPSQCFGLYDYDSRFYIQYEQASRKQKDFDAFIQKYVRDCPTHGDYLDKWGAASLLNLKVVEGYGYKPGVPRK